MKRYISLVPGIVLLSVLASCGTKKLTRGAAEDILDKVGSQTSISKIVLTPDQAAKLVHIDADSLTKTSKLINFGASKPCVPDASDMRIMTGQFILCPVATPSDVTWEHPGISVTLMKPVAWKIVEVTGISDDAQSQNKIVEYTWKFELPEFPGAAERIINRVPPQSGKALLRLYDDGWRFVEYK